MYPDMHTEAVLAKFHSWRHHWLISLLLSVGSK